MIIIPMVGRSSRFFDAGYKRPKYALPVGDRSAFSHAVCSFRHYFDTDFFLFLVRSDFDAESFVRRELSILGVKRFHIKVFEHETLGQADTVFQGLQDVDIREALYIFNIDTFRPGFLKPAVAGRCNGYLEVFEGEGEHWSFVEPGLDSQVIRTTEKQRISNLCSDGLYFFQKRSDFEDAYNCAMRTNSKVLGEVYVAPLYNYLIDRGLDIRYVRIDRSEVVFCGTPLEYEALVSQSVNLPNAMPIR